jgi:hypothetical protein
MSEQHDERLAEIRARVAAATRLGGWWHSPEDIAWLIGEVERLHAELAAANAKIGDALSVCAAVTDEANAQMGKSTGPETDAVIAMRDVRDRVRATLGWGSPCTVCEHTVGHDEDCPAYRKALRAKPAQSEGK